MNNIMYACMHIEFIYVYAYVNTCILYARIHGSTPIPEYALCIQTYELC